MRLAIRANAGRLRIALAVSGLLGLGGHALAADATCSNPSAIGVSRVVELDASGGPIYGAATKFVTQERFLRPKEVLLTFDDGPSPAVTGSVLATLARFCTKATFFYVGRMAIAYPHTVKRVLAAGHTVGGHTWSHPLSLVRINPAAAKEEIERGFTAIALAAGRPIAPFFRFPGLSDNRELLTHLQERGVATFSVDVISNDSYIASADQLVRTTLARIEERKGGIVLFHDIKPQTAKALPIVLAELKRRGYRVVHLRSRHALEPDLTYAREIDARLAKVRNRGDIAVAADGEGVGAGVPVTALAPLASPVARTPAKGDDAGRKAARAERDGAGDQRSEGRPGQAIQQSTRWEVAVPRPVPPFRTTVREWRGRIVD